MSAIIKEVYDAFRSAGVSDEQATAAAQAVPSSSELANKGDIKALHSELKSDIGALRTVFKSDIRALRAETSNDMKDLELRMTIKFFAAVGVAVAGIKALDFLIG